MKSTFELDKSVCVNIQSSKDKFSKMFCDKLLYTETAFLAVIEKLQKVSKMSPHFTDHN
jgi:hypothetical protein